jgi:hypothetical protein
MYGALSDERTGLYLAVDITHWSKSRRTRNHILLAHLILGSLSVASYDSQGYGGGILTCLHTGSCVLVVNNAFNKPFPSTDTRIFTDRCLPATRVYIGNARTRTHTHIYIERERQEGFMKYAVKLGSVP